MRRATASQRSYFHPLLRPTHEARVTHGTRRPDGAGRQRWIARAVVTASAWLVAFIVVLALFSVFGDRLESLPPAWRAFVVSGILVNLMANLVKPVLVAVVARSLGTAPTPGLGSGAHAAIDDRRTS